ncbi:MAG: hypothetical protein ACE5F5_09010 [Acidimicrobiia bacterium]
MTRLDAPPDEPLLVVDDRVTGATEEVLEAGVTLGMPRREAEALAPFATVLVRDVAEEARRFEIVVELVEDLVPRVEVVSPGLLYVPVAGAVRFYGGERALAERVVKELDSLMGQRRGGEALVGVADGPFAARWAAATARVGEPKVVEDTFGFLSRLDLATLREAMGGEEMIDTFHWLGLSTLGELARLPREALASRFGGPGILAHRLASGEDRPVDPRTLPADLKVRMEFEDHLETLEQAAFVGRVLAERLIGKLRAAGVAPHAVTIAAESVRGDRRERMWRSADPFTEQALGERVWWQLRAWVENSAAPGGIAALEIDPSDLSGEGRQLSMMSDESSDIEVARALARAQSLLGPEGVLQGRPQGGRLPEERVAWSRWGEPPGEVARDPRAPWPGATPSPTPTLVPRDRRPLEVEWDGGMPCRVRLGARWEPVLTWSGPWRLVGRWWWGEEDADRYQLVTSAGAFLCVVVEGKAYLAGIYD